MNEGYKPENDNEHNENVESLEQWSLLKEAAPQRAQELLAERQIPETLEEISAEHNVQSIVRLSELIDELSQDNSNRYIARELSLYLEQAKKYSEYKKVPAPSFAQQTA